MSFSYIRPLSKFHLFVKIVFFGIFPTKFFDHVFAHALKILPKSCSKRANFLKQSEFRKRSIQENLKSLQLEKFPHVTLVAVSKGRSLEAIRECYKLGVRDFGENRIDELIEKQMQLPSDIRWHFIGKLQRNKVKKIIGRCFLIHSVDSMELAEKIARLSSEAGITTSILLETKTSLEAAKLGLTPEEWQARFEKLKQLNSVKIKGFMTMAPLTQDKQLIRACFRTLKQLQLSLGSGDKDLTILSMGMSHDYLIAIEEGSTMIRIGSALYDAS